MNRNNIGDILTQIQIQPMAEITATGVATAVDLIGAVTGNPSVATNYDGQIAFLLDALNTSGSSPTLAVSITHCDTVGGTYTAVTGGGFTGLTTTNVNGKQKIVLNVNSLKQFIQIAYTIGGTATPKYYVSIQAVAVKKNPA